IAAVLALAPLVALHGDERVVVETSDHRDDMSELAGLDSVVVPRGNGVSVPMIDDGDRRLVDAVSTTRVCGEDVRGARLRMLVDAQLTVALSATIEEAPLDRLAHVDAQPVDVLRREPLLAADGERRVDRRRVLSQRLVEPVLLHGLAPPCDLLLVAAEFAQLLFPIERSLRLRRRIRTCAGAIRLVLPPREEVKREVLEAS